MREALEDGYCMKLLKTTGRDLSKKYKTMSGEFEKQDHRSQTCHQAWVPEKTQSLKRQQSANGGDITDET